MIPVLAITGPTAVGKSAVADRAALDVMECPKGELEDERRASYIEVHERLGDEGLHALLAERDPRSAQLVHPHNVKRVIRWLDMHELGVDGAVARIVSEATAS